MIYLDAKLIDDEIGVDILVTGLNTVYSEKKGVVDTNEIDFITEKLTTYLKDYHDSDIEFVVTKINNLEGKFLIAFNSLEIINILVEARKNLGKALRDFFSKIGKDGNKE